MSFAFPSNRPIPPLFPPCLRVFSHSIQIVSQPTVCPGFRLPGSCPGFFPSSLPVAAFFVSQALKRSTLPPSGTSGVFVFSDCHFFLPLSSRNINNWTRRRCFISLSLLRLGAQDQFQQLDSFSPPFVWRGGVWFTKTSQGEQAPGIWTVSGFLSSPSHGAPRAVDPPLVVPTAARPTPRTAAPQPRRRRRCTHGARKGYMAMGAETRGQRGGGGVVAMLRVMACGTGDAFYSAQPKLNSSSVFAP